MTGRNDMSLSAKIVIVCILLRTAFDLNAVSMPLDISPSFNARVVSTEGDAGGEGFRRGVNEKYLAGGLPADRIVTLPDGMRWQLGSYSADNGVKIGLKAKVRIELHDVKGVRGLSFLTCGVGLNPMPDKSPNGSGSVTVLYSDGATLSREWVIGTYAAAPPSPAVTAAVADLYSFGTKQLFTGRSIYAQTITGVDPKRTVTAVEFSTMGIRDGVRDDAEFAVLAISGLDDERSTVNNADTAVNSALPAEFAKWTDADRESQKKAAVKLQADINTAIKTGKSGIAIPPGHYRFDPDGPISWLYLRGVSNFTISGNGVTFWGDGVKKQKSMLLLHECVNVTVRGVSFDYDPYSSTQGKILAIDLDKGTADIAIDPGFPLPDETWQKYKGSTKTVFFDTDGEFIPNRMDWTIIDAPLGGRNYRVKFQHNFLATHPAGVKAGDKLALPKRQYTTVIHVRDCERCTLEDVTLYGASDLSIYETGGAGAHTYRRCKVIRRPGTGRLVAGNADVFRSIKVARGALVEQCEFSFACDDLFNLQNYWWAVHEQTAPDEAVIGVIDNVGIEDIAGDTVEFYALKDYTPRGSVKVISAERMTDASVIAAVKDLAKGPLPVSMSSVYMPFAPMKVKFEKPIALERLDLMLTTRSIPRGAVIRDNYLHHCYTRAILMKTFDGRIENNRIEKIGAAAIQMVADSHFWEGPSARNILISNNTITDCGWGYIARLWPNNEPAAIVSMLAGKHSRPAANTLINRDIVIVNNKIIRPFAGGIIMHNTDGGKIIGNVIDTPFSRPYPPGVEPQLLSNAYAIFIEDAKNIDVQGNSVLTPGAAYRGDVFYGERTPGCGGQGK